jgi:hypothetical protein
MNMYDAGETIYEPAEHILHERLNLLTTWIQGYFVGTEVAAES